MSKFIRSLSAARQEKLGQELLKSHDLWRRCWQNHDLLDDASRRMMLEVMAKVPGSCSLEPPQVQALETVAIQFIQKEASASATQDQILTSVKTIRDVLETVLQMEWHAVA